MGISFGSSRKSQKPEWVADKGTTVFAFKAPAAGSLFGAFAGGVVVGSSGSAAKMKSAILQQAKSPRASVELLEPQDWDAPQLAGIDPRSIATALPRVVSRAHKVLTKQYGVGCSKQSLTDASSGAMSHPTGHVLFLFTIPGRPAPTD